MTPDAHDAAFAAVSHLPHLIAFALINAITAQDQGKDFLSLAGPGFRDFTRIAASEPKMWRDILLANRQELLEQSKIFQRALQAMEADDRERQRRGAGRPDQPGQRSPRALAHGQSRK